MLRTGELDGLFTTMQAPGHVLQHIIARGEARLISLPPEVQRKVVAEHARYRMALIPAHTYPGQTAPAATLAVTAMLVTRQDLPDKWVEQLLQSLFKSVDVLTQVNLRVGLLSPRTATEGLTLPLHPAAKRLIERLDSY